MLATTGTAKPAVCGRVGEMVRKRKTLWAIFGAAVGILGGSLAFLWVWWEKSNPPSNIVNFSPTDFQAKATVPFFYSIGDQLKHSDEIDPRSPTLMRGQVEEFLVSPDSAKIAVVANGVLTVVGWEGPTIHQVVPVDSIYKDPKPIGRQFFRDHEFQWSRDSKQLYLIKDEYYQSQGSQLFSEMGELWRYTVDSGALELVLKPFPAYDYFFGLKSGIYFSVPTEGGDLQLKYFDGRRVSDIGNSQTRKNPGNDLASGFSEPPFFSFSIIDYQDNVLPAKGVSLDIDQRNGNDELDIKGKTHIDLTRGKGIKGSYYCDEPLRSVFLPGDRYFLFNLPYCGNYNGQILIDVNTGGYKRLPKDSRVYLVFNTENWPYYKIDGSGIAAKAPHR
jgi:hypothetical protein